MDDLVAKRWRKRLVRWAGFVLLALCVGYLAKALSQLDLARLIASLSRGQWLLTSALALLYAASLSFLAKAWFVVAAPGRKLPLATEIAVYGPGTVAKYLPGSVFQYAARHVLGKGRGMDHGAMAHASVVEAILHVGIALAFAGSLLAGAGLWAVALAGATGCMLAVWSARPILASLGFQLLFFAVFASILIELGAFGAPGADPARLAGYFFLAWTVGFLVPIAPGGIGVREAVLIAVAAPVEGAGAAAMLALLARLVGIAGDGLFGLAGYLRGARSNTQASG